MGMQKPRVKFKGRVIGQFAVVEPNEVIESNPDHIQDNIIGEKAQLKSEPLILQLRLSELARRNIAIKIYSEVLDCEIWLCGNERIAAQLRQDDPETTVYTANEMRRLMSLNPDPKELMNIHIAKSVFPGSKIIDSRLKEANDGPDGT